MKGYFEFVETRRADLSRIARGTQGEYSREDLESEAWLIAAEMGEKRGSPIDLADVVEQEGVLGRLFTRFVKFADKMIRWGVSIDQGPGGDDGPMPSLVEKLAGPDSADPQADEPIDEDAALLARASASYSQASFYTALMVRVDWKVREVAQLVRVTAGGLRDRLKRLAGIAAIQPSLFDGRESVPTDFKPQPGRWRSSPRRWELDPRQLLLWHAEAAPDAIAGPRL